MINQNYELMQYFLNMIKEYAYSNPDKDISEKFVYSNLIRFNIRNDQFPEQNVKDVYFDYWFNRYHNNKNITVGDLLGSGYFLWFCNGKVHGNEIKLYIPMDYGHIKEGANQLFDFISSTNIEHQSKIAKIIRNDNVVVRVNTVEDAKLIIDYVNNNPYIKEGLIKVNPFLPNYNGIGLTMDNMYSFNSITSGIISEFITQLRNNNSLHLATVENLNKFIIEKSSNISKQELKDIYMLLSRTTAKDFTLNDFANHVNRKLGKQHNFNKEKTNDPKYYLEKAIIITEKFYPGNSHEAILQYLKSNPVYFTNKEQAREELIKYVKPGDLISIMRSKLNENNIPIPQTDKELIDNYLGIILNKNNNYNKQFELIKQAFISTLNAYDEQQAIAAIKDLYLNNSVKYFTNRFNDRTNLINEVLPHNVKKIILNSIDINGINDINNVNEIIYRFMEVLKENKTKKM